MAKAGKDALKANLKAMQAAVSAHVADAQRAARLNKVVDALREQLLSFDAVHNTFQSNIVALNARPDATRAEFETLIEQFNEQRVTCRKRVIDLHLEMVAATTVEEWKRLHRYERKLLAESHEP
jgi:hypothetical protein